MRRGKKIHFFIFNYLIMSSTRESAKGERENYTTLNSFASWDEFLICEDDKEIGIK